MDALSESEPRSREDQDQKIDLDLLGKDHDHATTLCLRSLGSIGKTLPDDFGHEGAPLVVFREDLVGRLPAALLPGHGVDGVDVLGQVVGVAPVGAVRALRGLALQGLVHVPHVLEDAVPPEGRE